MFDRERDSVAFIISPSADLFNEASQTLSVSVDVFYFIFMTGLKDSNIFKQL